VKPPTKPERAPVNQGKMPEVGRVGRNVIANVERLCLERGLSWRKLSAELARTGRPIPPLADMSLRPPGDELIV
jgi:hypothetical protein